MNANHTQCVWGEGHTAPHDFDQSKAEPITITSRRYIVHVAAPVDGQVQCCTRCDAILVDGRGEWQTPLRDHQPTDFTATDMVGPRHAWPVGQRIGVSVGTNPTMSYVIDRAELDDDESPCRADA